MFLNAKQKSLENQTALLAIHHSQEIVLHSLQAEYHPQK
jgi:hypothetical protein